MDLVQALQDYQALKSDELSFKTGELIHVLSSSGTDWWMGELRGKTGFFRTDFVVTTDKVGLLFLACKEYIPFLLHAIAISILFSSFHGDTCHIGVAKKRSYFNASMSDKTVTKRLLV